MITRDNLAQYLNDLLTPQLFADYAPNGLQVEGKDEIRTLITGVTASQALLIQAIQANADAILVHHGYFWKEELRTITGIKKARLSLLLQNNINLFAYHLPLDAHPELGNNVQLAKQLGIAITGTLAADNNCPAIGNIGTLASPCSGEELVTKITRVLNRQPLYIAGKSQTITKVAWCSGGGQWRINAALAMGVDAYITGEVSEATVHIARETGIHFYAAGHHATEQAGVQAVGDKVAEAFGITHRFINIDNPV